MKEDILEQIVEDYYISQPGWFVKHNVKYKPNENRSDYEPKTDSVHSDIDIIAINPNKIGIERVNVVSCKSWQEGFTIENAIKWIQTEKGRNWKKFRELVSPKWIESFLNTIEKETGQRNFTYIIAVTKLQDKQVGEQLKGINNIVRERLGNEGADVEVEILTLSKIIEDIARRLNETENNPVETTDVGRTLQLMKTIGFLTKGVPLE